MESFRRLAFPVYHIWLCSCGGLPLSCVLLLLLLFSGALEEEQGYDSAIRTILVDAHLATGRQHWGTSRPTTRQPMALDLLMPAGRVPPAHCAQR